MDELNKKLAKQAGYTGSKEDNEYLDAMAKAEKNKKLAEWAGFELWEDMKGNCKCNIGQAERAGFYVGPIPSFTQSLDACFKWLTPKVIPMLADIDLSTEREAWYKLVGLWLAEPNPPSALALCLAIEKLIDGGKQ